MWHESVTLRYGLLNCDSGMHRKQQTGSVYEFREKKTRAWRSSSKRSTDAKQEGVAYAHLEVGVTPAVWSKVLRFIEARD